MKALDVFLRALESNLGFKQNYFLPLSITTDTRFPAVKTLKLKVYKHKGECISEVTDNYNINTSTREEAMYKLIERTIQIILKRYGI